MNANELRIGNYVYDSNKELNKQIAKSNFSNLDYLIKLNIYQHIPITQDWLLKFGFKKQLDYYKIYCNNIEMYTDQFRYYPIYDTDVQESQIVFIQNESEGLNESNSIFLRKTKYVHELQNLYFAITGKELNF